MKRIDPNERMHVKVQVLTHGDPSGVKIQGGLYEIITREIEIECLPDEIPDHFDVNVAELAIGQSRARERYSAERVDAPFDGTGDRDFAVVAPRAARGNRGSGGGSGGGARSSEKGQEGRSGSREKGREEEEVGRRGRVGRLAGGGLGNPGSAYERTWHNLGFLALERLAERNGIRLTRPEARAVVGSGRYSGTEVVLAKPQTFMNLSGTSVQALVEKYSVRPSEVVLFMTSWICRGPALRIRPGRLRRWTSRCRIRDPESGNAGVSPGPAGHPSGASGRERGGLCAFADPESANGRSG